MTKTNYTFLRFFPCWETGHNKAEFKEAGEFSPSLNKIIKKIENLGLVGVIVTDAGTIKYVKNYKSRTGIIVR